MCSRGSRINLWEPLSGVRARLARECCLVFPVVPVVLAGLFPVGGLASTVVVLWCLPGVVW